MELVLRRSREPVSPYDSYISSLAPGSRRTQAECLDRIASMIAGERVSGRELRWEKLTYEHTSAIRAMIMEQPWSPAYRRKHMYALRRVLKECWRLGLMDAHTYQHAVDLEPIKGSSKLPGKHLPADTVRQALQRSREIGTPRAIRDTAITALAWGTGARRAEIARLKLDDYDGTAVRIAGKGHKTRLVAVVGLAQEYLEDWIEVRGDRPGALFVAIIGAGITPNTSMDHLSGQSIYDAVRRVIEATPHDLRRTLIGDMLSGGVDPALIRNVTGHEDIRTLLSYDRRNAEMTEDALRMIRGK